MSLKINNKSDGTRGNLYLYQFYYSCGSVNRESEFGIKKLSILELSYKWVIYKQSVCGYNRNMCVRMLSGKCYFGFAIKMHLVVSLKLKETCIALVVPTGCVAVLKIVGETDLVKLNKMVINIRATFISLSCIKTSHLK